MAVSSPFGVSRQLLSGLQTELSSNTSWCCVKMIPSPLHIHIIPPVVAVASVPGDRLVDDAAFCQQQPGQGIITKAISAFVTERG